MRPRSIPGKPFKGLPIQLEFELAIIDCGDVFFIGLGAMVVLGRQLRGNACSTISLSAFMPDWKMAASLGAKLIALLRPLCGWLDVSFEFDHSVARKFSRGVLDRPFDARSLRRWVSCARIGPRDFLPYVPDVCDERAIRSVVVESRRIVVYIINAIGARGSYIGRRILNIPRRQAYHDTLISHDVSPEVRHSLAYTANMLASAASMYGRLGINLIYLKAGLSAGGRLWPKYGFLPVNTKEWYRCRRKILKNLKKMPQPIQDRWGPQIRNLVDHPSPLNLRIIYQMDDRVPDITDSQRMRNLGPVLLTRTRWHGVLDLSDPSSRRIFLNAINADLAAASPV
jgi:hypothetical protein